MFLPELLLFNLCSFPFIFPPCTTVKGLALSSWYLPHSYWGTAFKASPHPSLLQAEQAPFAQPLHRTSTVPLTAMEAVLGVWNWVMELSVVWEAELRRWSCLMCWLCSCSQGPRCCCTSRPLVTSVYQPGYSGSDVLSTLSTTPPTLLPTQTPAATCQERCASWC